jgi:hypothetical protein
MTRTEWTWILVTVNVMMLICYAVYRHCVENPSTAGASVFGTREEVIKTHITVVKVDGCEYLHYNSKLTHKANCSNPIHKEGR